MNSLFGILRFEFLVLDSRFECLIWSPGFGFLGIEFLDLDPSDWIPGFGFLIWIPGFGFLGLNSSACIPGLVSWVWIEFPDLDSWVWISRIGILVHSWTWIPGLERLRMESSACIPGFGLVARTYCRRN